MQIGFLGLGQMGAPIAANLLRAGHHVTVWNRSPEKAGPLVALGATAAKTPKDAAAGKEVVMTMLADDAALETVLSGAEGLLAGLPAGALHLSMSTIGVATSERVAALHAARGQRYVAAPVFGRRRLPRRRSSSWWLP